MVQELTAKHYKVLLAIQEAPLGTYDVLAARTGFAKSVVYEIVQELSLGPKGRPCFRVSATPSLWALGLEVVEVLVQADSEKKLQYLEQLCDEHPYTLYHARCYGDTNGMLIQFRVPIGTSKLVQQLFQRIKDSNNIDDFFILPFLNMPPIYSTVSVDHWNPNDYSWVFDWAKWFSVDTPVSASKSPSGKSGTAKKWLKRSDVAIISELSLNARQKNIEIMESLQKQGFELTPQTFSRRLKKIKEQSIEGYRVFLDPQTFDLYNTLFFWGTGIKKELEKLRNRMVISPIPFTSTFKVKENQLFWYLHLPTAHLSDLLHRLRPILTDLRFNFVDFPRSETYTPYFPTFNDQQSDWHTGEEFMMENILKELQNSF